MHVDTGKPETLDDSVHNNQSHEEYQYLNLIAGILESGEHRPDR